MELKVMQSTAISRFSQILPDGCITQDGDLKFETRRGGGNSL